MDYQEITSLQIAEMLGKHHGSIMKRLFALQYLWRNKTGRSFTKRMHMYEGKEMPYFVFSQADELLCISSLLPYEKRVELVTSIMHGENRQAQPSQQTDHAQPTRQPQASEVQATEQPTMTSLELAEFTGKRHHHLLRSIRNMEDAWFKVHKTKFGCMLKMIDLPNGGTRETPIYTLTKEQCLYVATKFDDEMRAKLIKRWLELENATAKPIAKPEQKHLPEPTFTYQELQDAAKASLEATKKIKEDALNGKYPIDYNISLTQTDVAVLSALSETGSKRFIAECQCVNRLGVSTDVANASLEKLIAANFVIRSFIDKFYALVINPLVDTSVL